jgi:C-terminal processing protease CtpA/Prc
MYCLPLSLSAQENTVTKPADQPVTVTRPAAELPTTVETSASKYAPFYLDLAFPQILPTLGLEVSDVEPALRAQLELEPEQGLVVTNVVPESAGAVAQIQQNDVLLTLGGKSVGNAETFRKTLTKLEEDWNAKEGAKNPVLVSFYRGGKKFSIAMAPAVRSLSVARLVPAEGETARYWIGVGVADIEATLRSQLNLPEKQGLVVTEVRPDSPAEKAGIKLHDVLLEYNSKALATGEELRAIVNELGPKATTAELKLLRGGKPATLSVTPVERKVAVAYVTTTDSVANVLTTIGEKNMAQDILLNRVRFFNQASQPQAFLFGQDGNNPNWINFRVATAQDPQAISARQEAADQSAAQLKELVEAVKQLSAKVEALEASLKKSTAESK